MIRKVEEKSFFLGSPRTTRYQSLKRIFIEEGWMWLDAAHHALEDHTWYLQEHAHYLKLGERYAKNAEQCWLEAQRLNEEFYKCLIEAQICIIGAKVCAKGLEYTRRMFPERTKQGKTKQRSPK